MFVHVALREIAHHFGDFIDITGGDLFDIQLVTAGPVHFLFDDRGSQNLEHLGYLGTGDDVTHTDFLGVFHRHIDDQTVGGKYGQLQIFACHALNRPLGDGLHFCCTMTWVDDHIADLIRHVSSEN